MVNKSSTDLDEVLAEHDHLIKGLEKMILNMNAVHNIRYWYWCLSNFPKSQNLHEDMMKMDTFTTSIIISYGRLFGDGDGATKLRKDKVPESVRHVHDDIINLRHGRYAHHGEHETIKTRLGIQANGSSIFVNPGINFLVCLGAPKEWAPLFQWLDKYMYEILYKRLDLLTKKTGIEWKIQDGPPPHWIASEPK
jgi:hypothetical protein